MKRLLVLALIVLLSYSCRNKIETDIDNSDAKVEVKFSLNKELSGVSEGLMLSKAVGNDITAIQIYQRSADVGAKYKPYCYGLWDDLSGISVQLNKGYIYRFEVTVIPNGKQFVAVNDNDGSYRQPFSLSGTGTNTKINNEFIYHASNYLSGIGSGTTAIKNSKNYTIFNRPLGDRYYGIKTEVVISGATEINIETKRVVFGLGYDIKGFTDGEVRIAMRNAPDIILTPATYATQQDLITLQGSTINPDSWINDDYSEYIPFTVYWKKEGGAEIEFDTREANVMRKKRYTVDIDLRTAQPTGGFNIKLEGGDLEDGGNI